MPSLYMATSLADAVAALAARGPSAAPMAGATWIMRSGLRDEAHRPSYVALSQIAELSEVAVDADAVSIGACVTHARLASALADAPGGVPFDLQVLAQAAAGAANPQVRAVATVGGNLNAIGFAAADLVPALLCLDASVEIARPDGSESMKLDRFLAAREDLSPGSLVARIRVPRSAGSGRSWRSAHARLPLRVAGDYPAAIVSLAVALDEAGAIAEARVAVGAVENVARRWPELEARLTGGSPDPEAAAAAAKELRHGFTARDGVEAPGSYRLQVLPALVRRAMAALGTGR
ncbi:FAD binding domain-containing protein [Marinibaculum pumilum]|uniref:FAD binding domain-containing protein n=1 Tax=Marinibaculum pumilum TaxID=1766165 RepID=A0ABV7KUR5_9PROT